MSVNVKELLGTRVREWVISNLDGKPEIVPESFWVVPIQENDPAYDELKNGGLNRLKGTKMLKSLEHESLVFDLITDEESHKLCIGNKEIAPAVWDLGATTTDFVESELHFLQLAHIITKNNLPARSAIPADVVNESPIFEDDLLDYFPPVCVLSLNSTAKTDTIYVAALKALLALEAKSNYVNYLHDLILNVGYSIPDDDHEWIFSQLFSAVRAQRLINFYLEIYKLFEFFFPLQNIFDLADLLKYTKSELMLLNNCRTALSWNVNHQRGARAAAKYATVAFAETCLGEAFSGEDTLVAAFKERAVEKLTTARHELTHQDFRAVSIQEKDLLRLTEGLLIFLRDAFTEYDAKLESRRKRSQPARRKHVNELRQ